MALLAACAAALLGCNDIAGLSDLEFVDAGLVGDAGGGGQAPNPRPAADWSHEMLGLYLFETDNLGFDSPADVHSLSGQGESLSRDSNDPAQGQSSLRVDGPNGVLTGAYPSMVIPADGTFTLGMWARLDAAGLSVLAYDIWDNEGYAIGRGPNGELSCAVLDFLETYADTLPGFWPLNEWVHVVCRHNAVSQLAALVNGTVRGEEADADLGESLGAFTINNTIVPVHGHLDEVFLIDRAISDGAIKRIRACGVDGKACICQAGAPAEYERCGRADPQCDALLPCDAPLP